ncbi:hypothetical protein [Streptomyces formicae]|uniref:Secreted protein n=1 Tax=Streptomyces formicae TaxID=1616117 RepID=A0ABY3WEE8_9ACTN|nr:hypothetical protein [Streptomyces formicae]UNM10938.1 hypothetical protein J4032_04875 [Streptomyces formicae]
MNVNIVERAAAALATAALGLSLLTTPASASAQADPPPGVFPTLAGVCSDAVEPVLNELGQGFFGCWGPFGSPIIQTRPSGCQIQRPNGSSAAIAALNADITAQTHCLDFAGVLRGPNNTSTNDLSWLRFAKDGLTVAVGTDGGLATRLFTKGELQAIYRCEMTVVDGIPVNPLMPQAGSGVRTYWAAEMGIPATALPSCVSDFDASGSPVQENDGAALTGEGDLVPFAIPQYIAQTNGVVPNRIGPADIRPINGVAPVTAAGTFNTSFPITRDVYVVAETARLSETPIVTAFVGPGSMVCDPAVIELHGFGALSNCGSVAATGES